MTATSSQKVSIKDPLLNMVKPCAASIAHRNPYFHQYDRNATLENKKLFCDSRNHCKRVLKEARSNYADTTRRSVDLSLSDHVISGGFGPILRILGSSFQEGLLKVFLDGQSSALSPTLEFLRGQF